MNTQLTSQLSVPLRGPDAVAADTKQVKRLEDRSTPAPVGDRPITLGYEAMTGLYAHEKQADRLASLGTKYRGVFKSAYAGKSLRKAISAFCLDCVGLDPDEVRKCSAPDCPLWSVRTYRWKENHAD